MKLENQYLLVEASEDGAEIGNCCGMGTRSFGRDIHRFFSLM